MLFLFRACESQQSPHMMTAEKKISSFQMSHAPSDPYFLTTVPIMLLYKSLLPKLINIKSVHEYEKDELHDLVNCFSIPVLLLLFFY